MRNALAAIGLATGALGLVASAACGTGAGGGAEADESSAAIAPARRPHGLRALRKNRSDLPNDPSAANAGDAGADGGDPASAGPRFRYRGGPVIPNVRVHAVYWTPRVAYQERLNEFYRSITASRFLDALKEYDTTTTRIRRGSFAGSFIIQPQPEHLGASVRDEDIQAELASQIDSGHLPAPDGVNTLYMLHFPPGVAIVGSDGETSCVDYCAYHDAFTKDGKSVVYGIHPNFGPQSGCQQGCGHGTPDEVATSCASHELAESITDPGPDPALSWYNDDDGEIADVCTDETRVNGFVVQLLWSNKLARCALGQPAAD